jgi:2,3-bisphosphoglycerate-independent phosphoglycerate mutase
LTIPVLQGIAPGSGPGHLALFGYDPFKYIIGRGALEAIGVDTIDFIDGDIVARGNFCSVDTDNKLVDRRAGRIPSSESKGLCARLNQVEIDGLDLKVYHVKDYRFVLRIRGENLSDRLTETDPQRTGIAPLRVKARDSQAEVTAKAANEFIVQAKAILANENRANMVLLRGFSGMPSLPSFSDSLKLKAASIAAYPMYKGLTRICGMDVIPSGDTFSNEVDSLIKQFPSYDFFYIHYKDADAAGEDGNFEAKVTALENLDTHIPQIRDLNPDVLIIAGDHSTPSIMASHSWHPVPFCLWSNLTQGEGVDSFDEKSFRNGSLGTIAAVDIMTLALSHAGKLTKFGA